MTDAEQLLRRAYDAFNARDIESALALMHSDVDWPNAIEAAVSSVTRRSAPTGPGRFGVIDSHVEPESFEVDEAGLVDLGVHQVVRDLGGEIVSDPRMQHVYTLRDGLIERMDVREP